jgi:signal transduction histidine kinase
MGWRGVTGAWSAGEPVAGREHERRFLDRLALGLLPLAILVGVVILSRWLDPAAPYRTATFKASASAALCAALTLLLNRRGHHRWAGRAFTATLVGAAALTGLDRPEISVFVFAGVLVATALFSTWWAALVGAAALLAQAALLLRPGVHVADLVFPLCVNVVLLPLLFIVQSTHRQLDRSRMEAAQRSEKDLKDQLDRALRLESLGRLAGGVAHDFNNLLTVIGGGLSLALARTGAETEIRTDLEDVQEATRRAVALTRQLLAFSRRQVMQPRVVEINVAVREAAKMVRRILRENVELGMELDDAAERVLVDPVQLEQVLVNLAINGADAMPGGGRLTLKTDNLSLPMGSPVALPAGAYVRLRVIDTGCGMDQPTVERVFEPFFSTKEPGRGTGLGLSTVDGIVQQSGGVVLVDSALGRGTTFTILLPRTTQTARTTGETEAQGVPAPRAPESSTEALRPRTILIVEDDPGVRKLATMILNGQGYRVMAASSGSEALVMKDGHTGKIDLLITDLVLPGMSGPEIARTLRAQLAALPVLFMSGYADEVVAHEGMNPDDGAFLAKPFTPASLVASVRAAIG